MRLVGRMLVGGFFYVAFVKLYTAALVQLAELLSLNGSLVFVIFTRLCICVFVSVCAVAVCTFT